MFAESLFRHRVTDMEYTADGPIPGLVRGIWLRQGTGTIYTGLLLIVRIPYPMKLAP